MVSSLNRDHNSKPLSGAALEGAESNIGLYPMFGVS
jgi:hypothetical protein